MEPLVPAGWPVEALGGDEPADGLDVVAALGGSTIGADPARLVGSPVVGVAPVVVVVVTSPGNRSALGSSLSEQPATTSSPASTATRIDVVNELTSSVLGSGTAMLPRHDPSCPANCISGRNA